MVPWSGGSRPGADQVILAMSGNLELGAAGRAHFTANYAGLKLPVRCCALLTDDLATGDDDRRLAALKALTELKPGDPGRSLVGLLLHPKGACGVERKRPSTRSVLTGRRRRTQVYYARLSVPCRLARSWVAAGRAFYGKLGQPANAAAVLALLATDLTGDDDRKMNALKALSELKPGDPGPPLVALLLDSKEALRRAAEEALDAVNPDWVRALPSDFLRVAAFGLTEGPDRVAIAHALLHKVNRPEVVEVILTNYRSRRKMPAGQAPGGECRFA